MVTRRGSGRKPRGAGSAIALLLDQGASVIVEDSRRSTSAGGQVLQRNSSLVTSYCSRLSRPVRWLGTTRIAARSADDNLSGRLTGSPPTARACLRRSTRSRRSRVEPRRCMLPSTTWSSSRLSAAPADRRRPSSRSPAATTAAVARVTSAECSNRHCWQRAIAGDVSIVTVGLGDARGASTRVSSARSPRVSTTQCSGRLTRDRCRRYSGGFPRCSTAVTPQST